MTFGTYDISLHPIENGKWKKILCKGTLEVGVIKQKGKNNSGETNKGQARGTWTYHSSKIEIWPYHETLQSRITQKWLEFSLSFFHIMKIWDICGHLQLVRWLSVDFSPHDSTLKKYV